MLAHALVQVSDTAGVYDVPLDAALARTSRGASPQRLNPRAEASLQPDAVSAPPVATPAHAGAGQGVRARAQLPPDE